MCRNKGLLSFGDEPEEPLTDEKLASAKFKSSHDALDDPRLRKEVLDDRGTSAMLPPGMEGPPRKRKGDEESGRDEVRRSPSFERDMCAEWTHFMEQKRGKMDPPTKAQAEASTSKLEAARAAKEKAAPALNPKSVLPLFHPLAIPHTLTSPPFPSDVLRAEIAKVEADLKKMTRREGGGSDDEGGKAKKPKRTGPSLLQLEREKYTQGSAVTKGKKPRREELDLTDVLDGFKKKILEAKATAPPPEPLEEKAVGWDEEEDENVRYSFRPLSLFAPVLNLPFPPGRGLDGPLPHLPQRRDARPPFVPPSHSIQLLH